MGSVFDYTAFGQGLLVWRNAILLLLAEARF